MPATSTSGWTRYTLEKSEILFARSTDDGKTWSAPITISTDSGLPRGSQPGAGKRRRGAQRQGSGAVLDDGGSERRRGLRDVLRSAGRLDQRAPDRDAGTLDGRREDVRELRLDHEAVGPETGELR